jgi:electron transfer flavoprotein alpha subunit
MPKKIFAYILHEEGVADDTALELLMAAGEIDPDASVTAILAGSGPNLDSVCNEVTSSFQEIWKVEDEAFSYPDAEVIRKVLVRFLPEGCIVLVPHDHFGIDLAPGLSIELGASYLSDVIGLEGIENGVLKAIRQEYNGQVCTNVDCDISNGAVISIRPGSFKPDESKGIEGHIIDKTSEAMEGNLPPTGRRFMGVVEAETGEVDITQSEILISVGRGIGEEENLEIIHGLADAMGGDVSCSRPIVDAKWLEKARQVGSSGQTVKPKVYMALGMSGSFQHLAGIKGNPFMVAVNKNPRAPIFQVANVGVVADILEFVPELANGISERIDRV